MNGASPIAKGRLAGLSPFCNGVKIIIASGASGGHIYPAIALAGELKNNCKDTEIIFIAGAKKIDREIFSRRGFTFFTIPTIALPRRFSLGLIEFLVRLLSGLVKSFFILLQLRPCLVVGFGGYVSFPVVAAGRMLGIPVLLHEQNFSPGIANKIASRFANKIAVSFRGSERFFERRKVVFTGNPVRQELLCEGLQKALDKFNLAPGKFTLLVIGGSQGSSSLNRIVLDAVSGLQEDKSRFQLIHLTGRNDFNEVASRYGTMDAKAAVFSFFEEMQDAYRAADLVIARSGATTISELSLFGKPAILIPYPYAESHQRLNAKVLAENGAALLLEESEGAPKVLREHILNLSRDRNRLLEMAKKSQALANPGATKTLCEAAMELIKEISEKV